MADHERFEGTIGRTLAESTPWWPEPPHPGRGRPERRRDPDRRPRLRPLRLLRLDHRHAEHRPPRGERSAVHELPRHAAVLADAGVAAHRPQPPRGRHARRRNLNTGFPHMPGHISPNAATMAEVLRDEGYATFAVGKWHLCQMEDASAAGPYDQWPCQRGFDRFYGFLDGETDQFHPELVYDNHFIDPPRSRRGRLPPQRGPRRPVDRPDLGHEVDPARPAVLHLPRVRRDPRAAPGAGRVPREVPREVRRGLGRRRATRWFAKQKELGLVPARHRPRAAQPRRRGVGRPPREPPPARGPPAGGVRRLPRPHRRADRPARRRARRARRARQHDDRAALRQRRVARRAARSASCTRWKFFNFILETPDEAIHRLDDIGGPNSHTNYPWGWAQAGNTPFKWYKQNTHEGGVHVPCIVHWPGRVVGRHRACATSSTT